MNTGKLRSLFRSTAALQIGVISALYISILLSKAAAQRNEIPLVPSEGGDADYCHIPV